MPYALRIDCTDLFRVCGGYIGYDEMQSWLHANGWWYDIREDAFFTKPPL